MGRGVTDAAVGDPRLQAFIAEVLVSLKPGVNDPEGLAIRDGLHSLGFNEVDAVRSGKYLRVIVDATSAAQAEARVAEMCDRLLSNPVIEQYRIQILEPVGR
jgi:phosphoribosylformylglycinamidine synthase subunit PurS